MIAVAVRRHRGRRSLSIDLRKKPDDNHVSGVITSELVCMMNGHTAIAIGSEERQQLPSRRKSD